MNENTNLNKDMKDSTNQNEYEIPVGECFKLNAKKKLGSGAFGDIYYGKQKFFIKGINTRIYEEVAIKLVRKFCNLK